MSIGNLRIILEALKGLNVIYGTKNDLGLFEIALAPKY